MKQLCKRGFALVMVLVMLVGLLPAITFQASAASYTYNWGTRGELATELSDAAVAWYEKYNVTYDELAALSGSSTTGSVPSSALYSELKSLMTSAHSYKNSYDAAKDMFQYTDCQNGGGKISSFYSGTSIGPGWGEGGNWNREHTWPNSKGLGGSDENDIMMLRPTASSENSSRGNTAYGEGSSYYDPNDESGGTYNLHGDVARIVLYVYVRWGNTSYMWGTSGVMESKEVLLKWMEEDPVDTWELGRNDAVQSITGTRNVFVDYPELAFDLFEEEVPAGYDTPSGGTPAYTITATPNNASYGTVSMSGKTITAYPYDGYQVSGYTVTSGTATVTQSGNVFTVTASSDCNIQIIFSARTQATVSFVEQGVTQSTQSVYTGDTVTLPELTGETPNGYAFRGWVTAQVENSTTKPTGLYQAGTAYTVSQTTVFYALFAKVEEGTTGEVTYQLVTDISSLTEGSSVVIAASSSAIAMKQTGGTNNRYAGSVTKNSDNTLTFTDDALIEILTLGSGSSAGTYSFYSQANGQYLAAGTSSGSNILRLQSSVDAAASFAITVNSDGTATAVSQTSSDRNSLRYNSGSNLFACYASGQQAISFYVATGSGDAYYTTSPVECDHTDTEDVAAVGATCTASGYTAGVFCNDCGYYISGHEVVEALGHSYGDWTVTTAPTCTEAGEEMHTCTVCGDTETQSVSATGHSYGDWTVTTAPTCTTAGEQAHTCSACGDVETAAVAATGHSYVANDLVYTCSVCGDSYEVEASTTLQYVFSDYEAGTQYAQGETHELDEVITLTINGSHLNTQIRLYAGSNAVFTSQKVIDSIIVKAGNKAGTLNVYGSEDGTAWNLIAAQATTSTYTDYSFDMPADSSYKYLKLESVGAQIRVSEMTIVVLAAETTQPECAHENVVTDEAAAASCTASGLTEGSHCGDCGEVLVAQEEVPATGHSYVLSGTTYTCATCGDSYEVYFVEFSVPDGVAAVEKIEYTDGGVTLPEAGVPTGDYAYTFAGWALEEVDNSETAPTVYKAGQTFTADAATTLYAVYTYKVQGDEGGSGNYVKVTEEPADWSGEYVIVYETLSYIFDGSLETLDQVNNYQEVTITDNTITAEEGDPCKFTIEAVDGGYTVRATNGMYIGRNATSNGLNTGSTGYVLTISLNDFDNVVIASSYGPYLNFNAGETQLRFRFFKSGQKPIQIYVKDGSASAIYYTTVIGAQCSHDEETTVYTAPTCTEQGYTTYYCAECGEYLHVEDYVDATGHSYESVVTAPQVGVQGYTTHTCTVCGDSYVDSYTDPLPEEVVLPSGTAELKFSGATLKLEADLTMNVLVNSAVFAEGNYTNGRVEISMTDAKTGITNTVVYTDNYNVNGNYREYVFTGISPRKMNDTITLTVYGTYAGVEYSKTMTYSVATYAYNKLKTSTDTKFLTLLADLLNFGSAHQVYTNYNTDNLVNANMTETQKGYASTGDLTLENKLNAQYEVIDAPTASFRGASLVLTEKVEIQYIVVVEDLTDVSLKVTADGVTYTVDSSEFVAYGSTAGWYTVNVSFLQAKQMRSNVTAAVYCDDTVISNTALYSVESYAAIKLSDTDTKLVNLLKMMMYYGDSAAAYFA